jgi:DNA-binding Lrp family transcriptional regulator
MVEVGPDQLKDSILVIIGKYPGGVSLGELHRALKKFSRRTLGRRLAELVKEGKLRREGAARAARYFGVSEAAPAAWRREAADEAYVPLSEQGRAIRDFIRRPAGERRPVGYQREFLDRYVPNRSSYLPESMRQHLHHIGQSPVGSERPAGTYARQILGRLLIDLSWASSRLEGNTYSRLDTERLIQFVQAVEGKDATETQMILNHKAAIEFLVDQAEEVSFNRYAILNLHALLSENLLSNPEASGRLRRIPVEITGSVFHPLAIPQVLEECFDQILDTARAIQNPFEQSFFMMVHIPYLQPFEDVNKRVSRLAANIPLIQRNLCPLSFVDVPERAYT